jgi:hypothetical protein
MSGADNDVVKSLRRQNDVLDEIFDDNFEIVGVDIVFDVFDDLPELNRLLGGPSLVTAT